MGSKAFSVQKALRDIKDSGEAVIDVTIKELVINEMREMGMDPLCFPMSSHSFLIMMQEDDTDDQNRESQ